MIKNVKLNASKSILEAPRDTSYSILGVYVCNTSPSFDRKCQISLLPPGVNPHEAIIIKSFPIEKTDTFNFDHLSCGAGNRFQISNGEKLYMTPAAMSENDTLGASENPLVVTVIYHILEEVPAPQEKDVFCYWKNNRCYTLTNQHFHHDGMNTDMSLVKHRIKNDLGAGWDLAGWNDFVAWGAEDIAGFIRALGPLAKIPMTYEEAMSLMGRQKPDYEWNLGWLSPNVDNGNIDTITDDWFHPEKSFLLNFTNRNIPGWTYAYKNRLDLFYLTAGVMTLPYVAVTYKDIVFPPRITPTPTVTSTEPLVTATPAPPTATPTPTVTTTALCPSVAALQYHQMDIATENVLRFRLPSQSYRGITVVTIVDHPPQGNIISIDNTDYITYMPDAGFVGSDSFTWKVNDGTCDSNVGTVSIRMYDSSTGITPTPTATPTITPTATSTATPTPTVTPSPVCSCSHNSQNLYQATAYTWFNKNLNYFLLSNAATPDHLVGELEAGDCIYFTIDGVTYFHKVTSVQAPGYLFYVWIEPGLKVPLPQDTIIWKCDSIPPTPTPTPTPEVPKKDCPLCIEISSSRPYYSYCNSKIDGKYAFKRNHLGNPEYVGDGPDNYAYTISKANRYGTELTNLWHIYGGNCNISFPEWNQECPSGGGEVQIENEEYWTTNGISNFNVQDCAYTPQESCACSQNAKDLGQYLYTAGDLGSNGHFVGSQVLYFEQHHNFHVGDSRVPIEKEDNSAWGPEIIENAKVGDCLYFIINNVIHHHKIESIAGNFNPPSTSETTNGYGGTKSIGISPPLDVKINPGSHVPVYICGTSEQNRGCKEYGYYSIPSGCQSDPCLLSWGSERVGTPSWVVSYPESVLNGLQVPSISSEFLKHVVVMDYGDVLVTAKAFNCTVNTYPNAQVFVFVNGAHRSTLDPVNNHSWGTGTKCDGLEAVDNHRIANVSAGDRITAWIEDGAASWITFRVDVFECERSVPSVTPIVINGEVSSTRSKLSIVCRDKWNNGRINLGRAGRSNISQNYGWFVSHLGRDTLEEACSMTEASAIADGLVGVPYGTNLAEVNKWNGAPAIYYETAAPEAGSYLFSSMVLGTENRPVIASGWYAFVGGMVGSSARIASDANGMPYIAEVRNCGGSGPGVTPTPTPEPGSHCGDSNLGEICSYNIEQKLGEGDGQKLAGFVGCEYKFTCSDSTCGESAEIYGGYESPIYTSDSDLCSAARHAFGDSIIPWSRRTFNAIVIDARVHFGGGPSGASFPFGGETPNSLTRDLLWGAIELEEKTDTSGPTSTDCKVEKDLGAICTYDLEQLIGSGSSPDEDKYKSCKYNFSCQNACSSSGRIWGNGSFYSSDSDLCSAVKHKFGESSVPWSKRTFKATIIGKRDNFQSSTSYGITSYEWTSDWRAMTLEETTSTQGQPGTWIGITCYGSGPSFGPDLITKSFETKSGCEDWAGAYHDGQCAFQMEGVSLDVFCPTDTYNDPIRISGTNAGPFTYNRPGYLCADQDKLFNGTAEWYQTNSNGFFPLWQGQLLTLSCNSSAVAAEQEWVLYVWGNSTCLSDGYSATAYKSAAERFATFSIGEGSITIEFGKTSFSSRLNLR